MTQNVTEQEAINIAYEYMYGTINHSNNISSQEISEYSITANKFLNMYIINMPKDGWVLVSGDKRIKPILAYSDEGTFPNVDSVPPAMLDLLSWYEQQINLAQDGIIELDINENWENTSQTSSNIIISPLLNTSEGSICWNQSGPDNNCEIIYNKYCPLFEDYNGTPQGLCNHSYVGCTPTAMGMIMRYYKWPYSATVPTSITSSGSPIGSIVHHYNWEYIPTKLTKNNSPTEVNEIALLLRDCGFAAKTKYSITGSSATLQNAANALKNTFHYSSNITHKYRNKYSNTQWINILKEELNELRPILYCGFLKNSVGHAFVIDGYKSDNTFHVNFGHGINLDYYFSLDDIYEIIDNNTIYYTTNQQAVTGIEPAYPSCSNQSISNASWNSNFEIYRGGSITISNQNVLSNMTGVIYSGKQVQLKKNINIKKGSNLHIAINDMSCSSQASTIYNFEDEQDSIFTTKKQTHPHIEKDINIYPNPVQDVLYINTTDNILNISIYDINGKKILTSFQRQINVSTFTDGMYLIKIETNNNSYNSFFIKI